MGPDGVPLELLDCLTEAFVLHLSPWTLHVLWLGHGCSGRSGLGVVGVVAAMRSRLARGRHGGGDSELAMLWDGLACRCVWYLWLVGIQLPGSTKEEEYSSLYGWYEERSLDRWGVMYNSGHE